MNTKLKCMRMLALCLAVVLLGTDSITASAAEMIAENTQEVCEDSQTDVEELMEGDETETSDSTESDSEDVSNIEELDSEDVSDIEDPDSEDVSDSEEPDSEEGSESEDTSEMLTDNEGILSDKQEIQETVLTELSTAIAGRDYVENEVVNFCDTEEDAQAVADAYNLQLKSFEQGVAVYTITDVNRSVAEVVTQSASVLTLTKAVYPNYYRKIASTETSVNPDGCVKSDVGWDEMGDPYLNKTSPYFQWYNLTLNSVNHWSGVLCQNHTIAIFDTGIVDSPEFAPAMKAIDAINSPNGAADTDGHGSHIAGMIAGASDNHLYGRGIRPGQSIVAVKVAEKVTDLIPDSTIFEAVRTTISETDARIMDFSFGSYYYNPLYNNIIDEAYNAGILVVAPVGDDNVCGDYFPAACEGVVGVSAINSKVTKSSFSNYGNSVDLCAPGGDVIYETGNDELCKTEYLCGFGTKCYYGTAEAAACVAAVASLHECCSIWTGTYALARLYAYIHPLNNANYYGKGNITLRVNPACANIKLVQSSGKLHLETTSAYTQKFEDEFVEFYYTLDGTTPSRTNGTRVKSNEELPVNPYKTDATLKAIAYCGMGVSNVVTQTYTKQTSYGIGYDATITPMDPNRCAQIAVGKNLQLTTDYEGQYGKIKWSSQNTLIATVSSTGLVTAKKAGLSTYIYAQCGEAISSYEIKTTPLPTQVSYNINTEMTTGKYSSVYMNSAGCTPSSICTEFTLSSSNPAIIKVEGKTMTALKSGTATVTATLMDGSNKKFSKVVTVKDTVVSIQIQEKSGKTGCVAGQKLYPYLTINNTSTTIPNEDYVWSVVTDVSGLVKIDSKTGVVTTAKNDSNYVSSTEVTIQATHKNTSKSTLTDTYKFVLYPRTQEFISTRTDYTMCTYTGSLFSINNIYGLYSAPEDALDDFTYSCNNNKAVVLDSKTGLFRVLKPGKTTFTVKANDGSNVTKKLTLTVEIMPSAVAISAKPNTYRLIPGASLQLKADAGYDANNKYISFEVCDVSGNPDTTYATIDKKGKLKVNNNLVLDDVTCIYVKATWQYDINGDGAIQYAEQVSAMLTVEIYPATQSLQTEESAFSMYTAGKKRWLVSATPATACQKFTYTSSNILVASIDRQGIITGYKGGTVTLTARATDGSNKKITCKCTVIKCSVLELDGCAYIAEDSSRQIKLAEYYQKDVNCKDITYSLENGSETIASVSEDGMLTANPGTAGQEIAVKLTTDEYSKVFTYKVYKKVASITFEDDFGNRPVPINYYKNGSRVSYIDLPLSLEEGIAPLCIISSNNKIVNGYYSGTDKCYRLSSGDKKGIATITLMTLDGSDIKKTFKVVNKNEVPLYFNDITTKSGVDALCAGQSVQFSVKTNASEASNKAYEYSIYGSGTEYATITKSGKLTANSTITEKTIITVRVQAKDGARCYATRNITLYPKAVRIAKNNGSEFEKKFRFKANSSFTPNLCAFDKNGETTQTCQNFTFKSSNPKVVSVSSYSNGSTLMMQKKSGTAYITATLNDGSGMKIKFKVVVYSPVTALSISQKEGKRTLISGSSLKLEAVTNDNADNKKVTWTSENENILTVNSSGVVTAKNVTTTKTCRITATSKEVPEDGSGPISVSYSITVTPQQ